MVCASTGIAALLLSGGLTAHRAFGIPLDCDSASKPTLKAESSLGRRLAKSKLIIIDEVGGFRRERLTFLRSHVNCPPPLQITMLNVDCLRFIDESIRSIMTGRKRDLPFGGKVVCISGDWKQLLPVVEHETPPGIMAATIRNSPLYERFQVLRLTHNMRVLGSEEEAHRQWLRDLGNGRNFIDDKNLFVEVPEELMVGSVSRAVRTPPHPLPSPL
jgi:nucleoside-triphosphatase THEP1